MTREDEEHLKLLSILHIVHAVLIGGVSLFPLIYVVIGGVMIFAPSGGSSRGAPPPAGLGAAIMIIGLMFSGFFFLKACANAYTAYCLKARKSRVFCMVTAGFNCLSAPLGTALGVFTFIVLQRPAVQAEFEKSS